MSAAGVLLSACMAGYAASELPELVYRSNAVYSVLEAAAHGDAKVLKARISEGCSVNQRDEFGSTPLHLAAAGGHDSCVKILIRHGADPVVTDAAGKTPSQLASDAGTRKLCERGVKLRERELELCRKVEAGDIEALKAAMGKKRFRPDMLAGDNQHSLLMLACKSGKPDMVKLLLKAKPDLKFRGPNGRSALHLAVDTNKGELVTLLLQAGADPMAKANNSATPLHDAVWAYHNESVKALLPAYKDCNFSPWGNHNGYPFDLAVDRNNTQAVIAFTEAGFNPNDKRNKKNPPLHRAARKDNADMVRALLKAGADKTARDEAGRTAAEHAGPNTAGLF